jgi:hypothetical protein
MTACTRILLVVLLFGAPLTVVAQQPLPATVEPGARLRVTVAPEQARLAGRFVRLRGDSLELQLGTALVPDTQVVALQRVTRIEVSLGRRHPVVKSAVTGGAIGLVAGVIFGALVPEDRTLGNGGFYYWTRGATVALWGSIGAGSGILAGLAVGLLSPERWAPAGVPSARPGAAGAATVPRPGWQIPLGW